MSENQRRWWCKSQSEGRRRQVSAQAMSKEKKGKVSVLSDSLRPHGLYSPWNSPGQNTGLGSLSSSRGSSQPRYWTLSPTLQVDSLPTELIREALKVGLSPTFCYIQAQNELHDVYPHFGEQSPLLSTPIQIIISSRNTLTDTPRNLGIPWTIKLVHKMNHHSVL